MSKKDNKEEITNIVTISLLAFVLGAIMSAISPFITVMIVFLTVVLLIRYNDKK